MLSNRILSTTILLLLLLLPACAPVLKPMEPPPTVAYLPQTGDSPLTRYAPVFWIEENANAENRVGEVRAESHSHIHVDPDSAVIYAEQRAFSTTRSAYTNLIYRVHFQKIPGGFSPFFLGAGKNVGLLIIVTLDNEGVPLLYTTLHTCGCYLAFTPTSALSRQVFPQGWKTDPQAIYGERLPSILDFKNISPQRQRLQVQLRPGTHRAKHLWLAPWGETPTNFEHTAIRPMSDLTRLPLPQGGTTSFYAETGSRRGYVKGSFKTRERLLMSWWAFDWKIGQDKYLGQNTDDGPVFYTSLKPWARRASDLRDFAGFLNYWGWKL